MVCKEDYKYSDCSVSKTIHSTKWFDATVCMDCANGHIIHIEDQCCKNPEIIHVNMPRIDGTPLKRWFCKNCGAHKQMKMSDKFEWKRLPIVTKEQAENIEKEVFEKRKSFFSYMEKLNKQLLEKRKDEFHKEYSEYLKSPKWRALRDLVLERDKGVCQACLINKATQVHHLTYDNVYNEFAFQLVSVCEDCHNKIHNDVR